MIRAGVNKQKCKKNLYSCCCFHTVTAGGIRSTLLLGQTPQPLLNWPIAAECSPDDYQQRKRSCAVSSSAPHQLSQPRTKRVREQQNAHRNGLQRKVHLQSSTHVRYPALGKNCQLQSQLIIKIWPGNANSCYLYPGQQLIWRRILHQIAKDMTVPAILFIGNCCSSTPLHGRGVGPKESVPYRRPSLGPNTAFIGAVHLQFQKSAH